MALSTLHQIGSGQGLGNITDYEGPRDDRGPMEDPTSTLEKTRDEDCKKGKAVLRQIALWDILLDARIRLQKSVVAANRLPAPSDIRPYISSTEGYKSLNRMLKEATALSKELFELQENLSAANEPLTVPPRKYRKIEKEDATDYSEYLSEGTHASSTFEQSFHPYLVHTLSKWSSKIQAVAPSVLLPSNRNAFSKNSQHLKSIVQLIDETLVDHVKLLGRTQVQRGKNLRIGVPNEDAGNETTEEHTEIFDDTDFYQQLLRDIIDARRDGKGETDGWMVTQKQKRVKNKVDTKASKGRKLRYQAHEKLQNFMVPVPVIGAWHEEQIDELFASLLGRGFESSAVNVGEGNTQRMLELEGQLGETQIGEFRVFEQVKS